MENQSLLCQSKLSYLAFAIDDNGLNKLSDHISSVTNARILRNNSELRDFIGWLSYYSKFVQNFT